MPQRRVSLSPRVDYQLNANNTLIVRYGFLRSDLQDAGIGSFNLVSRGYHLDNREQHVQISETAVLGGSAVNELRFQFMRTDTSTIANTAGPAILVAGSFNGGGAGVGHSTNAGTTTSFRTTRRSPRIACGKVRRECAARSLTTRRRRISQAHSTSAAA